MSEMPNDTHPESASELLRRAQAQLNSESHRLQVVGRKLLIRNWRGLMRLVRQCH
jgi:hypothetical protein